MDAPIATNTGEILIGGTWVWEYGDLYQQSGMTSQPIVLQTDGTWTLSFTAKDAVYNGMVNWENAGPNIDIGPWSWSPLYWNDGSGNSYAFYFSGMAPSAPSS